ncbi:MAG: YIP1 family protein [Tannerellaceae bacterium]|nr:YIP1 family protein [Tannerellaceae bacterium]
MEKRKMYKELFNWIIVIISQPAKAFYALSKRKERDDEFLARFVYPLIGLVTLSAFLGILFTRKEFDVELALKASIKTLVSSFGGFFLAAYLLNEVWAGFFGKEKDMKLCQRFVGYSSALMFALNTILLLLPEFFFLRIFILYTVYIVWEGAVPYMKVEEDIRLKFVAAATVFIVAIPELINTILFMLMPGLRI